MNEIILSVKDLNLDFVVDNKKVRILSNICFDVRKGSVVGIVGESGSGKTQTMMSILGLLPKNAIVSGEIFYNDIDLLKLSENKINEYRWNNISIAFQDSMTALNPYLTIKEQLIEPLLIHKHLGYDEAIRKALDMLDAVQISDAKKRINFYPHEFSGGMRQRVMIAMALICEPEILIADELTTALDVTVKAQIIKLLKELQEKLHMSILFITHDLGILSKIANEIIVMYCGHIMEHNTVNGIFNNPTHPYTNGLLASIPKLNDDVEELPFIPGELPRLDNIMEGCPFASRCLYATERCRNEKPTQKITNNHVVSCFNF